MSITHPADPIEPAWNEYEYEPIREVGDSWRAQNLLDHAANPPSPPSIGGCLYAGKRHVLSGEPESGKSWLSLAWCLDVLHHGGSCVYIDHEMGASMTLERLRVLGVQDDAIERFRYVDPSEPATLATPQILELINGVDLVVIDSTIGSLALHGYDPNNGADIEHWYQRVIEQLRAQGAAIVVLDHVTKNADTRGMFSIGSERKIGVPDVHLTVDKITSFSRKRAGKAKVTVKKDRPGHLARPTLGTFTIDPNGTPNTFTWEPSTTNQDDEGHFRPTTLMQRVSEYLETNSPASKKEIEQGVTGKAIFVRQAIEALVREGYVNTEDALRNHAHTTEHTLIKPYSEALDPYPSSPSSPPRPTPLSPNGKVPLVPLVPPFQGGEGTGRGVAGKQTTIPSSLTEPCPSCSSPLAADPWPTAGGTYCCHDCARGEACACKYLQETSS